MTKIPNSKRPPEASRMFSILNVIFWHYVAKLFITKARKHEKVNFVFSRFRVFVINLSFLVPAWPGLVIEN